MKITVKKALTVNAAAFVFLLLCSLTAYTVGRLAIGATESLIVGGVMLVLGGVCALLAGRVWALSIPAYILSSVAMGFSIRAWYIFRGFNNPLWLMLLVSLGATLCLWLFWALSQIRILAEHPDVFTVAYILLSLAAYLAVMLTTKTTYVSTFGYYMLVEIAFLVAMRAEWEDTRGLLRTLSVSSFSVFALVAVAVSLIALAVLSGDGDFDADCCECVECLDVDSPRKTKRKK